jgi:gluconolactonase
VQEDGSLKNGRVFARLQGSGEGRPDGMKVDAEGNVYVTGPGGVWAFSPQGKHLETIRTPEVPANLAFGGEDGRTLYITARRSVYSVQVKFSGAAIQGRPAEKRPAVPEGR